MIFGHRKEVKGQENHPSIEADHINGCVSTHSQPFVRHQCAHNIKVAPESQCDDPKDPKILHFNTPLQPSLEFPRETPCTVFEFL